MTREELKRLRIHYQVLKGQQRALDQDPAIVVGQSVAGILQGALDRLESDFPGLVPRFNVRQVSSEPGYFEVRPLRAHLATALGILEVQIADEPSPVVDGRAFPFLRQPALRKIVERDYVEIQRCFVAQCWKSVIILAGGAIEAVLADLLLANEAAARAAPSAPQKSDLTRWDLAELINVAVELKLITPGVSKLSHPVREYRNLVHPGNVLRSRLDFGPEEARIAIEVLNMLHRDLSGGAR